jgi:beta-fructofuranosidase
MIQNGAPCIVDDKGRRIMIGWMEKWLTKMPSQEHGWAGAMTIPRELLVEGGTIVKQKPVIEMENLRTNEKQYDPLIVEKEWIVNESMDESSEVIIDFDLKETTASYFGLQLRCSVDGNERTEIILDAAKKEIIVERNLAGVGEKGLSSAPFTINDAGTVQIRIFIDSTSVEVFVNDGEQVITNRIFPEESSKLCKLFLKDGKVSVSRMTTRTLNSVWE